MFREALGARRSAELKKELATQRKALQRAENRIDKLDKLFKRIYKDLVNEKLLEARFDMLSDDYMREQVENVDRFINQVKKHLYLNKLPPPFSTTW